MFPKIGVPQNEWFIMENPIKMGWFGGTIIFGNTHISKLFHCRRLNHQVSFPPPFFGAERLVVWRWHWCCYPGANRTVPSSTKNEPLLAGASWCKASRGGGEKPSITDSHLWAVVYVRDYIHLQNSSVTHMVHSFPLKMVILFELYLCAWDTAEKDLVFFLTCNRPIIMFHICLVFVAWDCFKLRYILYVL